jgi:hypothetical protein
LKGTPSVREVRRRVPVLGLAFLLLVPALAGGALLGTGAPEPARGPAGLVVGATNATDPNGITCPSQPINVSGIELNCISELEITEVVVILLTVTITLWAFKDADRAELPGEAEEVAVTAEEILVERLRMEREHIADRAWMEAHPPTDAPSEETKTP